MIISIDTEHLTATSTFNNKDTQQTSCKRKLPQSILDDQ